MAIIYNSYYSASMALLNHAATHACTKDCPTAIQLNNRVKQLLGQASSVVENDVNAARAKTEMSRRAEMMEGELDEGFEVLCSATGCRAVVAWKPTELQAKELREQHAKFHKDKGVESCVEVAQARRRSEEF